MPQVIGTPLTSEGMLADYRDVFLSSRRTMDPRVSLLMDLGAVTNGRSNTRGYFESAPHMRYQGYGDPIVEQAMDSKSFQITNYIYSLWIPYSRWDAEDDKTSSLPDAIRAAGKDGGLNPERGLFDLLLNTTSFVPIVPNAADGNAAFLAGMRHGVSTGNSITVSSWSASGPAARGAIWAAYEQMLLFQDGQGQPLHGQSVLDSPMLVLGSAADADVIHEAMHRGTVAYANSTSNAGVDNVLTMGGRKFLEPWLSSRISTGTMFVALTGAPVKPFLMQERSAVREMYADETNDPEARRSGRFGIGWNQRLGFGVGLPYAIVKVTAS